MKIRLHKMYCSTSSSACTPWRKKHDKTSYD